MRTFPADLYDALELSSLAYGGIGAGRAWASSNDTDSPPFCVLGHACFVGNGSYEADTQLSECFDGNVAISNDNAVAEINKRLGRPHWDARVTFAQWCAELDVVRGK